MSRLRVVARRVGWIGRWFLLLVLIAWLGARLWALHEVRTAVPDFEAKHGSIEPSRWTHFPNEPGVRAGRLLRAAALIFDRTEPDFSRWHRELKEARDRSPIGRVSEEVLAAVGSRNALALELAREASIGPECHLFESLPAPYDERTIDYFALLELDRVEQQLALADLERGNFDEAQRHLLNGFTLSDCLRDAPPQIAGLVGLAIERSRLYLLRGLVESGRMAAFSEALVVRLEHSMKFRGFWDALAAEAAIYQPSPERRRSRGVPLPEAPQHPWDPWSVAGFQEASALRGISRGFDILNNPEPPRPKRFTSFAPWRFDDHYFSAFADDWWLRARRVEAHAAARELALLATRLSQASFRGATEEELSRISRQHAATGTALVDERIEVKREPTGHWVVSLPATAVRWAELEAGQPTKPGLPWTWRIPPPAPVAD